MRKIKMCPTNTSHQVTKKSNQEGNHKLKKNYKKTGIRA